jgi:hypothetical protein
MASEILMEVFAVVSKVAQRTLLGFASLSQNSTDHDRSPVSMNGRIGEVQRWLLLCLFEQDAR